MKEVFKTSERIEPPIDIMIVDRLAPRRAPQRLHAPVRGYARPYIETLRKFVATEPNRGHNSKIREVLDFVEGRLW